MSASAKFARAPFPRRTLLIAVAGRGRSRSNAKTFGRWLLRNRRRMVGGISIEQIGKSRTGVAFWQLVKVN